MRPFLFASFLLLATALPAARRPNVVLIMPDDVSFNDFSFYAADAPRTPNVDQLAATSVRLTDFHVSPTCSPTRAALLTSRYNNATGVWHTILGRQILRRDEITRADIFRANGYRTALFGKWHLGENYPYRPQDRGFDHAVRHLGGGTGQQPDLWGNSNLAPSTYFVDDQPVALADEDDGIPGAFATNFFTGRAITWMQERLDAGEPFFAYFPFNVAHAPQDLPPDARPGLEARDATIENFDRNLGRLLRFLDESGAAPDTLLIFLTDNGGTSDFQGDKGSQWEGGHRVPCFIRWPREGLGGDGDRAFEVNGLAAHIDIVPTLLDLLKLRDLRRRDTNVSLEGTSLRPCLSPQSPRPPEVHTRPLVIDNQRFDRLVKFKQACVLRDGLDRHGHLAHKWRLVRESAATPWQLFDVLADPHQQHDLTGSSLECDTIATGLAAAYELWWAEVSARGDEYARASLGAPGHRNVTLHAHDWHTVRPEDAADPVAVRIHNGVGVPWNQMLIAQGPANFGYHAIEVVRRGSYRFDLRRWPREFAEATSLSSGLLQPVRDVPGRPLPIARARLRIWQSDTVIADLSCDADAGADWVVIEVPSLPAGPAFLQTWFYDAQGNALCGAYYTYVAGPLD